MLLVITFSSNWRFYPQSIYYYYKCCIKFFCLVVTNWWEWNNQRWSPRRRSWPRGQIFKCLGLASKPQVLGLEALGPRKLPCSRLEDSTIFEPLKFCWTTPETSRKICKHLFCFPQLEHRLSQASLPPIEISPMTKMWQKSLLFLQFQFLFSIFCLHQ